MIKPTDIIDMREEVEVRVTKDFLFRIPEDHHLFVERQGTDLIEIKAEFEYERDEFEAHGVSGNLQSYDYSGYELKRFTLVINGGQVPKACIKELYPDLYKDIEEYLEEQIETLGEDV